MSETTLTKDEVDEMRAEAAFALDATDGVPYRVRPIDVIRLCDAAEHAETLEDEHLSDRMLAEDDANTIRHLRAQLTELRQLRERAESDADEAIRGQLAAVKRAEAAEAQLTEVTRESVTRAQAAEMLARVAHRGQKELFGGDYIVHVDRVVALLATDDEKTVGWLHDIIEDCAVSHAELVKWFGPKIADTVCTLSRNPQATYLDYIDSIRDSGNTVAIAVKRADLLDHLRPETFHRLPAELRARYEAALAMFPESAPTPR